MKPCISILHFGLVGLAPLQGCKHKLDNEILCSPVIGLLNRDPLFHQRSGLGISWVECARFVIDAGNVTNDGSGLEEGEISILENRNFAKGVDGQVLRGLVGTSEEVDEEKLVVGLGFLKSEQNAATAGGTLHTVNLKLRHIRIVVEKRGKVCRLLLMCEVLVLGWVVYCFMLWQAFVQG